MTDAETLSELTKVLPNDLFESKDWKHSDIVGRVRWLLSMLESKTNEAEKLLDIIIEKE